MVWCAKYLYSKMDVTSVIDACQSNMLENSIHRKIDMQPFWKLYTVVYVCDKDDIEYDYWS